MAEAQNTSSLVIQRTAIDLSGRLGSLYDACQDQVLETLDMIFDKAPDQFHQKAQCTLETGDKNQNRNLPKLVGIDEETRLNLLLDLTQNSGITTDNDPPNIMNEYTRILHYSYVYREERFSDELESNQEWLKITVPNDKATHIITRIKWGIDVAIILQLPFEDNIVRMIDATLEKYRAFLNDDRHDFKLTRDDLTSYNNIISTKVYSNIPQLTEMTKLHDIFHNITTFKTDVTQHQQLDYTLYPISNSTYVPLDSRINSTELEEYLYELSTSAKTIDTYFNEDMLNLLCGHFTERLSDAYQLWSNLRSECIDVIQDLSKLITEIRYDPGEISTLDERLKHESLAILRNTVSDLTQNVIDLNAKAHLIADLNYQRIYYCNAIEKDINENDNEDTLKHKLIIEQNNDRILCSNDFLNRKNPIRLKELRYTLMQEFEENSELRLIYADFSYCSLELHDMMILSANNNKNTKINSNYETSSPLTLIINSPLPITKPRLSIFTPTLSSRSESTETINILLLGEIGVGKSTFINALVNYLTFKTLDKAESNEPIIVIPVSFLMTVGKNVEERSIRFDNLNSSHSEDFNHSGSSITQRCECYTYHLNNYNGRKLRIIDTPGFGDTRGPDQDDRNMQHILDFIKKLNYVTAICILLKPNESRLSIFFRSCLTQLFAFLNPNIAENIIFCFTNSRSTFYTPGNTAPLLKMMLNTLAMNNIPFKKENTFCFDSESFRYLVALQNSIRFSDHDRQKYETSWTNSVKEANRLIRYICKKLTAYPIPDECEAIKSTQIEIAQMTHPMVENMRYILRDIIISKINSQKSSVESHSNGVSSHELQNEDYYDEHLNHQVTPMKFLQDYKMMSGPLIEKQNKMIDDLSILCQVSAEFAHFLVHVVGSLQHDPFLAGLSRLIREENFICEYDNQNSISFQLIQCLRELASNHEQSIQNIKMNPESRTLANIVERVKYMHEFLSRYTIEYYRETSEEGNKITTI